MSFNFSACVFFDARKLVIRDVEQFHAGVGARLSLEFLLE